MILAAGLGTRLRPLTDHVPKALIKINNRSLLEYCILYLKYYGVDEIIINVHHYPDQIINFLQFVNNFDIRIEISDEKDRLLNTGGGLAKAGWFFNDNEPFVLMAVDVITSLHLNEMIHDHIKNESMVTLAVKERKTTRSLIFDEDYKLTGWKNNMTGEVKKVTAGNEKYFLGFSGIHVLRPDIFQHIRAIKPFSIIDLYLQLASVEKIRGYRHDHAEWYEFGRLENIRNADKNTYLKKTIGSFVKK